MRIISSKLNNADTYPSSMAWSVIYFNSHTLPSVTVLLFLIRYPGECSPSQSIFHSFSVTAATNVHTPIPSKNFLVPNILNIDARAYDVFREWKIKEGKNMEKTVSLRYRYSACFGACGQLYRTLYSIMTCINLCWTATVPIDRFRFSSKCCL